MGFGGRSYSRAQGLTGAPGVLGTKCKHCGDFKAEHTGGPCTHLENSQTCGCTNYEPRQKENYERKEDNPAGRPA